MGGSSSKTKTNIGTELVASAIARSIVNCNTNTVISQKVSVQGDGNVVSGVTKNQATKLSIECFHSAENMAKIQNEVAAAIKQAAESQSVALLGVIGNSDAEIDLNITNAVKNDITQETIQNIVLSTNTEQGIDITGNYNLVKNVTQAQTAAMVSKNTQAAVNQMNSIAMITNAVDQAAKSTQEDPVTNAITAVGNAIAGIMDAFSSPMTLMLILIAVVAVAYILSGGPIPGLTDEVPDPGVLVAPGITKYLDGTCWDENEKQVACPASPRPQPYPPQPYAQPYPPQPYAQPYPPQPYPPRPYPPQPRAQPYPQQPYAQPYPPQPYPQPYAQQPYAQPYPPQPYPQPYAQQPVEVGRKFAPYDHPTEEPENLPFASLKEIPVAVPVDGNQTSKTP